MKFEDTITTKRAIILISKQPSMQFKWKMWLYTGEIQQVSSSVKVSKQIAQSLELDDDVVFNLL